MNKVKIMESGINYEEGLDRFGGNVAMYEKYLLKFFDQNRMSELEEHIKQKDYEAAENAIHGLKGTSGNVSVNQFYHLDCELEKLVRDVDVFDDEKIMKKFLELKKSYELGEKAVRGN